MKSPVVKLALLALSIAVVHSAERSWAGLPYTGVNLAGAEFGPTPTVGNLGVYGTNYTYPTTSEVNYFVGKGMNTFRLPFRWERLQHSQNATLDSTELGRITAFVNYAASKGAYVVIDPHNFERYYPDPTNFQSSSAGLVGSAVPDSAFANFWSQIANTYKNNSHVIFNLMNEPNTMPTEQLVVSENAAIAAIRQTGAQNLILVPGNGYTGAAQWDSNWYGTTNAEAMLNIVDPGHNYAFDVHMYLDSDGSGTSSQIANNDSNLGVTRLTAFTQWMHDHNLHGFLGEFAVANSTIGTGSGQIGDETLKNLLGYMQANNDVWLGWDWWGGGPWWGDYMFALDPAFGVDRPAMGVLQPFLANVPEPSSFVLAALGLIGLVVWRRGKR